MSESKEIYVGGETVSKVRMGQFDPDTARVVIDTVKETGYRIDSALPAAQVVVSIGNNLPAASKPPAVKPPLVVTPPKQQPKEQPFTIDAVRIESIDERSFRLVLDTSGRGSVNLAQSVSPPELTLIMKGGTISDAVKSASGTQRAPQGSQVCASPLAIRPWRGCTSTLTA